MKVLFLPFLPIRDASSRYRIYRYVPHLERRGVELRVIPPVGDRLFDLFYHALIHHREDPLTFVTSKFQKSLIYSLMMVNRLRVIATIARGFDVVVVHRTLFLSRLGLLEPLLRRYNPRIVYDYDDALFAMRAYRRGFGRAVEAARAVIAGNDFLAAEARRYCPRVTVIPTSVDLDSCRLRDSSGAAGGLTIGWVGNPSGFGYLEAVKDALAEVLMRHPQVRLRIVSDGSRFAMPDAVVDRVSFELWRLATEVDTVRSFDIGIMPLPADRFSQGKCGFKLIQYLAVGLAVVCSPVGVNRSIVVDGQTGFLADSPEEWVEKLSRLIKDAELRIRLGQAGRQIVVENFTIEKNVGLFHDVLREVAEFSTT